ncbi:MAG: hypothetical protein HYS13_18175 [Planctomycetia bacterium]|nr:hypothetical protein [Planctomycetia bacterium]
MGPNGRRSIEGAGRPLWRPALALAAAALALAGCSADGVATQYGSQQAMYDGDASVNGMGVLAEMLRKGGHEVYPVPYLGPNTQNRGDVVVWFCTDYFPPDPKARQWLEDWLQARSGRTVVYVVRDYDAEPAYWAAVAPKASASQAQEVGCRAAAARGRFLSERNLLPLGKTDWGWFDYDGTLAPRRVTALAGDPDWIGGVDATKADIELFGRLLPSDPGDEVLVQSQGDALVVRRPVGDSQIVIVANGSFLLNFSLVNKENRKLAGALIDELGQDQTIVCLETGCNPEIREAEPEFKMPGPLDEITQPPFSPIYLHLVALAIVFCFVRWPIFGRPKDDAPRSPSDFGQHVRALGELLANSGNTTFARTKLMHYLQLARAERRAGRGFIADSTALSAVTESKEPSKTERPSGEEQQAPSAKTPSSEIPGADAPTADKTAHQTSGPADKTE